MEKSKPTPKRKRRRGRPTRRAASARILRTLIEAGIDPLSVDPRKILAAIAADASAPASARVSAARALLSVAAPTPPAEDEPERPYRPGGVAAETLSERAIALLAKTRRVN